MNVPKPATKRRWAPLPVPIPSDLRIILRISQSHLCHINAGDKRLEWDKCFLLLDLAVTDKRLAGLSIHHLRQETIKGLHHFYGPAKKAWNEHRKLSKKS